MAVWLCVYWTNCDKITDGSVIKPGDQDQNEVSKSAVIWYMTVDVNRSPLATVSHSFSSIVSLIYGHIFSVMNVGEQLWVDGGSPLHTNQGCWTDTWSHPDTCETWYWLVFSVSLTLMCSLYLSILFGTQNDYIDMWHRSNEYAMSAMMQKSEPSYCKATVLITTTLSTSYISNM